ncbi:hypothetical protein INR49_030964 [Caranx melampygus]|nr:hypothetical protein INR49_030964 [Caranx melampygus]
MDGLHIFLVVLFGAVCFSQDLIHNPVSEVAVRPGDNITLYCDCKKSTGVYIVWYRNCSHENQPTLVLGLIKNSQLVNRDHSTRVLPRFEFLSNDTSNSYDLLIMNITDSDEGLYYCGTEQTKVEDDKYISPRNIHSYGNAATRITVTHEIRQASQRPKRKNTQTSDFSTYSAVIYGVEQ